ncbi:MAG: ATP-binding cassette domain-containing protein [Algicola sp.]|nr:ATP-binding cassette domain-containing protein [Algicola sp.]
MLDQLLWSRATLPEGLTLLGAHLGSGNSALHQSQRWNMADNPNEWLREQSAIIDLGAQRVEVAFSQLQKEVATLGACLIGLNDSNDQCAYLVVASTGRRGLKAFDHDGNLVLVRYEQLLDGFINSLKHITPNGQTTETKTVEDVMNCFKQAAGDLSPTAKRHLFVSLMANVNINHIWTFSPTEKIKVFDEIVAQGGLRHLMGYTFGLLATPIFYILSWFILGNNVLSGRVGSQWLAIWIILLIGYIIGRLYTRKKQVELSLMVSVVIKRRMLRGMTGMALEKAKHAGPCHLLTQCYESSSFESNSVGMVLGGISALITLFIAMTALIIAQLWGFLFAFFAASAIAMVVMYKLYKIEVDWTAQRITLTHNMAELMIGHRTRRVQEDPSLRNKAQDVLLKKFLSVQTLRNKWQVLYTLVPSTWNVLGFTVLLYMFITNTDASAFVDLPAAAAVWLLINIAISELSNIYIQAIRVLVAWQNISLMLTGPPPEREFKTDLSLPNTATNQADAAAQHLLEVRDLAYNYPGRNVNVLDGFNLRLSNTDKIILEGHSGSGKSTLISLLTGIRPSSRGSILLNGIEQNMLSKEQWGSKVVMVPQFHENYLFTETLAFNLLLGAQWPAEQEQMDEARMICEELGLGTLLSTMPAGLMQVVGDMGWALSHGEKSRVFVARAILQHPELIILDESLASLDPVNSQRVLDCVEKHCKAVIIVAHP